MKRILSLGSLLLLLIPTLKENSRGKIASGRRSREGVRR
jgi:hypothetical protein